MSKTFKTKTEKPSKLFLSPSRIQLLFQMGGRSKIWETQSGDRRMERNDGRAFGTGHFHCLCLFNQILYLLNRFQTVQVLFDCEMSGFLNKGSQIFFGTYTLIIFG